MKRLVVVGGGVSGLAAARAAADRLAGAAAAEIVVLERESRVGGKAQSTRERGFLVEGGPNGFLAPDPAIERLVGDAGLEGELLPSDAAASRRFVVRGGRMREVSAHPLRFAGAGVLGPGGLLRLLAEPLVPARPRDSGEESVWDFARRRLGRQAADRLVAPMVLGIFAGDARRLSLEAAFPRLHALEAEHGSLVRGMLARRREARRTRAAGGSAGDPAPPPASGPAGPGGRLTSFRQGMSALPEALARRAERSGSFEVRRGAAVEAVAREGRAFRVELAGEAIRADAVVLACEAWAASDLVAEMTPGLARRLGVIAYPPVAVVALGFERAAAAGIPRGFGVLAPRGEGCRALGVLWESCIFPGRSPQGTVLTRSMFGGAVDPEAPGADDATLLRWAQDDLRRLTGVEAPPVFHHVRRWQRAIPQYELGHASLVREIEAELAREPGLFVAGNALHGIAFGRAAAAGLAAGEAAAQYLVSALQPA